MVTRVGIAGGPADQPDHDQKTGVDRDDNPCAPVQVNVIVGARRTAPVWINADDPPPVGAPSVIVRGPDGLFRADPRPMAAVTWGDPVRFRPGPPSVNDSPPIGAVHIDTRSGRGYRYRDTEG